MMLHRTALLVLVFSVGVLCQQSQSYQDILQNAGQFIQNAAALKNVDLENLLKTLSNINQKQVLQLASQFLSRNESFGTNATVSSSSIPGLLGTLSKIPNAGPILSKILTSGNSQSVLESAAKILPNLLKSNVNGSNLQQQIGSGSLNNVLPLILKNVPPQLLGTAQHIMTLIQSGNYVEAISEISKISKMYKPSNNTLSGNLSESVSPLAGPEISETCRQHAEMIINAIGKGETWALKMLDAMGKVESGIFTGHLKWLGSFDECRQIQASVKTVQNDIIHPFKGQYCTIGIPVGDIIAGALGNLGALAQLYAFLGVGFCIPDSCDKTELQTAINQVLPKIPLPGNKHLYAVYPHCQENNPKFDKKAIAAIATCSLFIAVMAIATLYDVIVIQRQKKTQKTQSNGIVQNGNVQEFQYKPRSDENGTHTQNGSSVVVSDTKPPKRQQLSIPARLLLSFSVYTNGKKLLNTNQSSGSITSINGIRFISMTWVILGHTYAFIFGAAANIGTFGVDIMKRWTFTAISNALVSVDTFFTLSGFLLSYLILKEMKKKDGAKGINWGLFYFHRFWRLTPAYMLILFVSTATSPYWSDGPMWNINSSGNDNCNKWWWTNLLYINNIVKSKEMCFGHAWYLANDMQFYVLSPLLFIPLFYNKIVGFIVCGIFLMTTTIVAGVVSSKNNLQPSSLGGGEPGVTHGDYMDLYYFKPWCRMGPYIIGIIGGYILYKLDCKLKINKILNLCIWLGAAGVACAIVYGLYGPIKQDNPLSNDVSALYNATHRTMWGICICWVIIACATGNGGYINTLLSWKGLIPLSRLTYCAYLVHPSIMYLYYNSIRKQTELTDLTCIYLFFGHLVLSYMVAFVSSLAFESPMMGLEKVIFGGKASKKPKPPPPAYEESNITVVAGNNGYINRALDHIKPDENGYTLQQRL